MSKEIVLSILIPSVPERILYLNKQIDNLYNQIGEKQVELLVFIDNRKRTTGRKRNNLIDLAQGKYIVFVDDDDTLSEEYVSSLLNAIIKNPEADCIVFDVMYHDVKKDKKILVKYGKEYSHDYDAKNNQYTRKPNHLMCYSNKIASDVKYENISYNEDDRWGNLAHSKINNQVRIDKILYTYDYVCNKPHNWYFKE